MDTLSVTLQNATPFYNLEGNLDLNLEFSNLFTCYGDSGGPLQCKAVLMSIQSMFTMMN